MGDNPDRRYRDGWGLLGDHGVNTKDLKNGKTVYILNTDGKGKFWLNKQLIGRDISRKDAIGIAKLYARSPLWLSRRKALSHIKLYSPMRLP